MKTGWITTCQRFTINLNFLPHNFWIMLSGWAVSIVGSVRYDYFAGFRKRSLSCWQTCCSTVRNIDPKCVFILNCRPMFVWVQWQWKARNLNLIWILFSLKTFIEQFLLRLKPLEVREISYYEKFLLSIPAISFVLQGDTINTLRT